MLELFGTVFGAIFSGGATGILGVVAQRYADYKNKQLDIQLENQRHVNAVALREVDSKIMAQEAAAKVQLVTLEGENASKLATIKTEGAIELADVEAFGKSYDLEPKMYNAGNLTPAQNWVMVILDAFRGAVRPMLTIYLCVLTTMIYVQARGLLAQEDLDVKQAMDLMDYIVHSILYLTTTISLWWFGTRNKESRQHKKFLSLTSDTSNGIIEENKISMYELEGTTL